MRVVDATEISALESQLAIERERNRQLEAQLRNLADHDPLTDVLNRRSVEQELEVHLARCRRYGPEGAFLLVEVGGLSQIASALGQSEADRVLAALAEAVVDRLRATDVTGRWGAHELAVLLPRAADAEVAVVADALARIVGQACTPRVPPGSLSASIGAAPVVEVRAGAAQLVARARQAMVDVRQRGGGWGLA